MRTIRVALQIALATTLATLLGCSAQPPTRAVTGQLRTAGMQLDNPVVIAESSDHRVFVTHVSARGTFKLQLPPGVSYRLTLANSTRSGAYVTVAKINWPLASGPARWADLGAGAPLSLGNVYRRGTSPSPAAGGLGTYTGCDSCDDDGDKDDDDGDKDDDDGDKDDDDDCKEEDDAEIKTPPSGKMDDCDCDDEIDDDDNCGKDDDADKHEKECDDDDQDDGDDDDGDDDDDKACDAGCTPTPSTPPTGGGSGSGGPCAVNADCASGLACVNSTCTTANTGVQ